MDPFTKIVNLGTVDVGRGPRADVVCKIAWKPDLDDRERMSLSIVGVEGPIAHGGCRGSVGQISLTLGYAQMIEPAAGWTAESVEAFLGAWRRWHLNDMRAGAPDQQAAIAAMPQAPGLDWYATAQEHLSRLGILASQWPGEIFVRGYGNRPAVGYVFGSGWVREDVPEEVLAYFANLPSYDGPGSKWWR